MFTKNLCSRLHEHTIYREHHSSLFAVLHGLARFKLASRTELIVLETRLLQREIAYVLQQNLLIIDLSTLISDVMNIADLITLAAEESIRAFNERFLAA